MPTITTLSGSILVVDMGSRDFESYRSDVLDSGGLADMYTPNWTDRSELDMGVALTEMFSFMGDNISYYQDRCANEGLWNSITQRRSVIEQSAQIDYALRGNVSAQVEMTIVCNAAGVLPINSKILVDTSDGSEPATFELEAAFTSTGAGTYTGVIALHGETVTDSPYSSTGGPGQKFFLDRTPVALSPAGTLSLEIWVTETGPAEKWSLVSNFNESGPTDKVYRVETDEDDVTEVIFGDGVNGKIPDSGTDNVSPTYRVGGGTAGNEVGPNRLTKLATEYSFVDSVTNPKAPSGGLPKETIDEAKVNAPQSLKALNRAVAHQDYEALALEVPGVKQAKAYRGAGAFDEHIVIVAGGSNPVPTGTWNPYTETGTGLLGAVGAYILERCTTPVILHIDSAYTPYVNVSLTAYLFSNVRQTTAIRDISEAVAVMFDPDAQVLGKTMPQSQLIDIVEGVAGVDYLDLHRFQRIPYGRQLYTSSATPSDITFTDFISGVTATRDVWKVKFINTTDFNVEGASAGPQVNTGTVGSVYTVDDGSLSFLVNAGTVDPTAVEQWEIVTGPYVGNLFPFFDELCLLFQNEIQLTVVGGLG